MNDEETVALIAGGHAFCKTHGAGDASQVDSEPEASPFENVGLGWSNSQGKGHSEDTISSGLEVTWSTNPTQWDNNYLELMYKYEWTQVESPAGAIQWAPIDCEEQDMVPHAHLPGVKVIPNMLTTDLALRFGDEKYDQICKDFLADFDYFSDTFARAWFKLTHRDMGPRERYQGAEVPSEILIWQDPVQENNNAPLSGFDLEELDGLFEESSMSTRGLLNTAWSSASSFRNTDKRGGATGARIFLEPQRSWPVNNPITIAERQAALQVISDKFSGEISMSDLIVYGGVYAIKKALAASSVHVDIPFYDGRGDATQEQTDIESFNYLYPVADAFTNWCHPSAAVTLEEHLINKAALLGLTPVEMTALVGGLRGLAVSGAVREHGDFSENVGIFNNDYFKVLLDMDIVWVPSQDGTSYSAFSRDTREALMMSASRADLVFASNSVLRAYAEVYASADGLEKLAQDFVAAWTKVMNADLF
jgi:catalase-peroxidase